MQIVTSKNSINILQKKQGFTLLEVLLVLTILGFLVAIISPAAGLMSEKERGRITKERMDQIRRAMVGDPDRFDESGRRIIGGYVGDMEAWPDLFEAAPECKNAICIDFAPEGDAATLHGRNYYFRPSGEFSGKKWGWNTPFRKLTNDNSGNCYDHIGGLATENEGQPLGLWTDAPFGDSNYATLGDTWRGPYLIPPVDRKPEDARHLAETDAEYDSLTEVDQEGGYGQGAEHFDDKEEFRLRQTIGRLEDGWHRSLRFFISDDPDHTGETIFWIISEGADGEATYPAKGHWSSLSGWANNTADTMSATYDSSAADPIGYNPGDKYNLDNIVVKLHSYEWRAIIEETNETRRLKTQETFDGIRRALIGNATPAEGGFNCGFTGSVNLWPKLFQWEDNNTPDDAADDHWDDADTTNTSYTKGQIRTLWTDKPNTNDEADDLGGPSQISYGIGWSGPYLPVPSPVGAEQVLLDGWGREVLFFLDDGADDTLNTTDDILLMLSRGADGLFDFGATVDGNHKEPAGLTDAVDVSSYDINDAGGYNADNVVMQIAATDWKPALLTLHLRILNVGNCRAMFVRGLDAAETAVVETLPAGALTDEDGDGGIDDWYQPSAFHCDNATANPAVSGNRQLIIWNDNGANPDTLETGEDFIMIPLTLQVHQDLDNTLRTITIDAAHDLTRTW